MFGRKVAIDASMALYQFLIAVRSQDGSQLTNQDGETTRFAMFNIKSSYGNSSLLFDGSFIGPLEWLIMGSSLVMSLTGNLHQ